MIRVGARSSKLSMAQTKNFTELLSMSGLQVQHRFGKSIGDVNNVAPIHMLGSDGIFTSFLEELLLANEIDIAVHSMKDLPIQETPGVATLPVLQRETPADLLIIRKELAKTTEEFPVIKPGTRIATSSVRRQSQLTSTFQGCVIIDVRGNIDTRINKLMNGWFDGLVLSAAALNRLPRSIPDEFAIVELPISQFPTAPAQGQLAVQLRAADHDLINLVSSIAAAPERDLVAMERDLYAQRGNGCIDPVGITIVQEGNFLKLHYYEQFGQIPYRLSIQASDLSQLRHRLSLPNRQKEPQMKAEIVAKTLVVTQNEDSQLINDLRESGYQIIPLPVVNTFPQVVDEAQLSDLSNQIREADWALFTSKRGARYLPNELQGQLLKMKIAALGVSTAAEVRKKQLPVHYISKVPSSKDLIMEIMRFERISKVVHFCGSEPTDSIEKICRAEGIELVQSVIYKAVYDIPAELANCYKSLHAQNISVLATSALVAKTVLECFPEWIRKNWIVLGNRTKQALLDCGVEEKLISPLPLSAGKNW